jgi:hypothetical protein
MVDKPLCYRFILVANTRKMLHIIYFVIMSYEIKTELRIAKIGDWRD